MFTRIRPVVVIVFCFVAVALAPLFILADGCPPSDRMQLAPAPTGSNINVCIDGSWDTSTGSGQTVSDVWNATRDAVQSWNDARGTGGTTPPYTFSLNQNASCDVKIFSEIPSNNAALAQITGERTSGGFYRMSLPPSTWYAVGSGNVADLQGIVGHELSHVLGLENTTVGADSRIGTCSSRFAGSIMDGGQRYPNGTVKKPTKTPQTKDVDAARKKAFDNSTCSVIPPDLMNEIDTEDVCLTDPCASAQCPNFDPNICANEIDETVEETPDEVDSSCTAWWNVTSYFSCNTERTQCTYLGSDWQYLGTTCSSGGDSCGGACTTCGSTCQNGNCMFTYECSPIILAVGQGSNYQLTSPDDGVWFDLDANGTKERVAWTQANDPVAFLVLDQNGNGQIDNGAELFGNFSVTPTGQRVTNGFEALTFYDKALFGGNDDGLIDRRDAIWSSLRLWVDWNHDGVSQATELYTLDSWQLTSISLKLQTASRQDGYGNVFRLKAPCQFSGQTRFAYDVFFSVKPQKRPNE